MADRRSDAGAKGLATEASCLSTRRKSHPLTIEEKVEQTRLATKRRSVEGAELLADEATRLSAHRKTNPSTVEQKAKNAVLDAVRYRQSRLIVDQKEGKVRIETERRNTESSQARPASPLCDSICDGCRFRCCECISFKQVIQ